MKKIAQALSFLLVGFVSLTACNKTKDNQTSAENTNSLELNKANQLVKETNQKVHTFFASFKQVVNQQEQMGEKLEAVRKKSDLDPIKTMAQSVVSQYKALRAPCQEIADAFDTASKMKVSPLLQEYWSLKSKAWKKRLLFFPEYEGKIIALIEAIDLKNLSGFKEKATKHQANIETISKEVLALDDQAEALIKKNPNSFKTLN